MQQRALLFKLLEVTEAMRTFFTQRLGGNKELCTKLKWAESDLAVAQKAVGDGAKVLKEANEEIKVAKSEACRMKEEREAIDAKCKNA